MPIFRESGVLVADGLMAQSSRIEACLGAMDARSCRLVLVLQRIPDSDYAILKAKNPWIIAPHPGVMGWNGRVPEGKTQIIYLPESLERMEQPELKLLIAHELAHCVLGHTDSPSDDPAIEEAAWQKVIDWKLGKPVEVAEFRKKHNQLATQS
jgi:hypothetical protein